MAPDIGPAEGPVQMDTPDIPAQLTMTIQGLVDIDKALPFGIQPRIGVHQVSGIQQQALPQCRI